MNIYRREKNISKHLPRAFCLSGLEAEQKVLYPIFKFLGNKTQENARIALPLNRPLKQTNKIPAADV